MDEEKTYEEIVKELKTNFETGSYKIELIKRTLYEKEKLRKVFAILLILNPARFGEITEKTFVTRKTLYTYLYQLKELGLLEQIAIMDIWGRKNLNEEEKKILEKFDAWSKTMAKKQIQFFAAKTNYWILTDLGKDVGILNWVLKLEKELKNEG